MTSKKKEQPKETKNKIVIILQELIDKYPKQEITSHLSIAFEEYDLNRMSDKEFLFALEKYHCEKELDFIVPQSSIEDYYNPNLESDFYDLDEQ